MATNEIQSAFVRQRRTLMIVSLVLTAVLIFGIDGSKVRLTPGGGGVTVDIGDPKLIVYALWIAWGWFLYRYWQHFLVAREESLAQLRESQKGPIGTAFKSRFLQQAEDDLRRSLHMKYPKAEGFTIVGIKIHRPVRRIGWRRVNAVVLGVVAATQQNGQKANLGEEAVEIVLPSPMIWPGLIRAITPVNIKHPYFSEYWTAFVFACLPPLIAFIIPGTIRLWELVVWNPYGG